MKGRTLQRRKRTILAIGFALVAVPAFSACSSGDGETSTNGRWTADDVEAFDGFSVFWAGESYRDAPLVSILRASYASEHGAIVGEDSVSFLYGTCDLPAGEGGCASPYQVIIQPSCLNPPGLVVRDRVEETVVRGAPAELDNTEGGLTLWTQEVAITLYAPDREEVLALADALIPANDRAVLDGHDFAPRESGAC